jgi:tetratricopeptide (TPR) repeat protein
MARARKKRNSAAEDQKNDCPTIQKSRRRIWFFRLTVAVFSPLIFFCVLEGILRLIGFGYPTNFFLHQTVNGKETVIGNNKFGSRFFGPALARMPYPLTFSETKSPDTIRIFVFGESAAYGDPQPDFGLPRVLEALLRERYPGVRFEVINAAMVAINSHVILPITRECVREHGDIWLIYMGNNEVVGPFGGGTVFGPQAPPLPLIRGSLAAKSTRTGELLSDLLTRIQGVGTDPQWRGMMMFVKQQVRHDDPRMTRVYSHFERNLNDILREGVNHGAKIIVSTVGSNLKDCAPFASQHRPDFTVTQSNDWNRLYVLGVSAEATNDVAGAEKYFSEAAKLDDHFADLQFRWARTCLVLDRIEDAQKHFGLARDYDTLRFRADSRINEIIRRAATDHERDGIFLLDAADKLAKQSPHGLCGEEFFYEHVHFTFEGNYAVARLFADQITKLLPDEVKRVGSQRPWLTIDECARALGWNDWSKHQTLALLQINVPPFSYQLNHAEMLQHVRKQTEQLASALTPATLRDTAEAYRRLIAASPDDWVFYKKLAEVLQELDDTRGAAEAWRQVENLSPQYIQAPLQLNLLFTKQGNFAEAADEYARAIKLDQNLTEDIYARLLNKIGVQVAQKGGAEAALPLFKRAVDLRPHFVEARISLGSSLKALGKSNEAHEQFQFALSHPPTTPQGLIALGQVCYQEGWTNEAITNLEAALNLDPTDAGARSLLGIILFNQNKISAALEQFQKSLQLDPANVDSRRYLDLIQTNR